MADQTLFDLPTTPDQIGVILPPASLRRIKFSALDFQTARRAIIEYIQAYFSDTFNDFVASNGMIMLVEIISAEVAKLAFRSDILSNEGYIGTATTEEAVTNIIALIGQSIRRQTPAIVDVQCTVETPISTNIEISAGTKLTTDGPDGSPIIYEIFRAPNDFVSPVVIPAGKRGIIAFGLEGSFSSPTTFTSPGGPSQVFTIDEEGMLSSPIVVTVTTGDDEDGLLTMGEIMKLRI